MSRNGQPRRWRRAADPPLVEQVAMVRPLVGYAEDFPGGHRIRRHRHSSAQLIYAASGVMTVSTEHGRWVVPPQRAVWVPAEVAHAIRMTGAVQMRTLYLEAATVPAAPADCCVVAVSPLLRELILRVIAFAQPYPLDGPEARLVAVVGDEIAATPQAPLHLPMPKDRRLLAVTARLLDDPGDQRTLATWSRSAGASARTLARLFVAETGMSFARWRQQARLLRALELLGAGAAVTAVALDLGYDSPSAFINMFRANLGTTPGRYFTASPGAVTRR
jgi:AraC-like DNA-binding protein/mannose-6-phosphate isomerase-like protein (cupin superfamily)